MSATLPAAFADHRRPDSLPLIDRGFLARQTHGSRELEREVLDLFVRQVRQLVGELLGTDADPLLAAHTLLGSARGVGAFALAEAAEAVEHRAIAGTRDAALLDHLCDVCERTLREIERDAAA